MLERQNLTNKTRKVHEYRKGDLVLVEKHGRRKNESLYEGPFSVEKITGRGNSFLLQNQAKILISNIKRIKPFYVRGWYDVMNRD